MRLRQLLPEPRFENHYFKALRALASLPLERERGLGVCDSVVECLFNSQGLECNLSVPEKEKAMRSVP